MNTIEALMKHVESETSRENLRRFRQFVGLAPDAEDAPTARDVDARPASDEQAAAPRSDVFLAVDMRHAEVL